MKKRKIFSIILGVIILLVTILYGSIYLEYKYLEDSILREPGPDKITGVFKTTKQSIGVVNGILLEGSLIDTKVYDGKFVEVEGYIHQKECAQDEQCWLGKTINFHSIKIIE